MNLFQKQQKTGGYNSIPHAIAADDETAAVPVGTTIHFGMNVDSNNGKPPNNFFLVMFRRQSRIIKNISIHYSATTTQPAPMTRVKVIV